MPQHAVLQQGASEDKGETARMVSCANLFVDADVGRVPQADSNLLQSSFVGAMAIADVVKSTLGPKGMVCCACPVGTLPQALAGQRP